MADEQKQTEDTSAAEPASAEQTPSAEAEAVAEASEASEAAEAAAPPAAAGDEEPAAEAQADAEPSPAAESEESAAAESEEPAAEAAEPAAEAAEQAASGDAEGEPAEESPAKVYTFEELKGMTVAQMREIAEGMGEHDALHGYTTMHKEELIVALCQAQGVEAHEHHEVVGIDKAAVKAKIRDLKQQREALIAAKDSRQLKIVRRRIRSLKRKIHKATV